MTKTLNTLTAALGATLLLAACGGELPTTGEDLTTVEQEAGGPGTGTQPPPGAPGTPPSTPGPGTQPGTAVPDLLLATFDQMPAGDFGSVTQPSLETELGRAVDWVYQVEELAVVEDEGGRSLRQRFVPGNTGSKVVTVPVPLAGANEVWMSYRVLFEDGFQFVKGGKLPGLAGGTYPTGGDFDDNGFSARLMWRENGTLSVYAYHHDRPEKWGEDLFLVNEDGSRWQAPVGQWLTIRERVKVNSTGESADGEVEVWVNGERKLFKGGLRWRMNTSYSVDRFLYSAFYGGSDPTWAPTTTTYARFDDFKVATGPDGVD